MTQDTYPDIIKALPKIEINIKGVEAWLAQGDTFQIVFFEMQPGVEIPPHQHKAQFGFVLEGEMSLTIGNQTHYLKTGDSYYIPEQVSHHGIIHSFVRAMDFFNEPDRYQPSK